MKKYVILLISLVCLNFICISIPIKADKTFDGTNISPGSFFISKNEMGPCSQYKWSFTISASRLNVIAFDSLQYAKLEDDRDSTDYTAILNTVSYPEQSGEWIPPYQDDWYIIFRNVGTSRYNVHISDSLNPFYCLVIYIFWIFIFGAIGFIIFFISIYVYKTRKAREGNTTWKEKLIKNPN